MNWGKSIVLAFILFAAFIGALVTICMQQDISLVTRDYYKEELDYQTQINRISHTTTLSEKPSIQVENGDIIKVHYPDFHAIQSGELHLFRPSDPKMDKQFDLRRSTDALQYFSTAGMERGMYRARMKWTMNGEEFYIEHVINL